MKPALVLLCALAVALLGGWFMFSTAMGAAATITVSTTDDVLADDGECSLREAVIAANTDTASGASPGECAAGSGADTIGFSTGLPNPAVFLLTLTGANEEFAQSGDLDIRQSVTIDGAGTNATIIDGNQTDRVLEVHPGGVVQNLVTVNQVTLRHGNPGAAADGGGEPVDATGRLTLNSSAVISSTATSGGGVKVFGLLTLSNSTVSGNQDGGVSNDGGGLIFTNAQVDNNSGGYGIDNRNAGFLTFNGGSVSYNQGGGVYNKISNATIDNVDIKYNSANLDTNGGGIYNEGPSTPSSLYKLRLNNSRVMSNTATSGGGVLNIALGGIAIIEDSRISYNGATAGGGGINNGASLTLRRSTLDHNQSRSGGAIDHSGGSLVLTNDTLSYNTVSDNGGGLYNRNSATLNNVTLNANGAGAPDTGGNIFNEEGASLSVHNSIVANASAGGNCANFGSLTSTGHNLESANSCGFGAAGDLINTNPLLGPLQDNGGPTWTQALLPGSPAIGAGDNSGCPATDQRGVPRPQGAACDIGSYELVPDGVADLSVTKVDATDPVTVHDSVIYTVTVSNAGPDTAQNVVMVDDLPRGVVIVSATADQGSCDGLVDPVVCNLEDMANGGSVDVVIVVNTTAVGVLTNNASVTSDTVDPNLNNDSASETTTVNSPPVPEADLSLGKVDAVDPVTVGDSVLYTVTVSNAGPDTAQNVVLTDNLPGGVVIVSATPTQGSCNLAGGVVTCNLEDMANGGSVGVEIVVNTTAVGVLTNNASVTSDTVDPNGANDSASEETTVNAVPVPEADLGLGKVDAVDPVTVGDSVIYTVTVSNAGPDTAQNVVLVDDLPMGVQFAMLTADQGSCDEDAGVVWCDLGDMANGGSVGVEIVVKTEAAGVYTNNASVTSDTVDPNPDNDSASETTTVNSPPEPEADLTVRKSDGPDPVKAGAILTYTVIVTNTGPDVATAVTVTDQLPAGVTYSGASGDGWSCGHAGGVVTCTLPSLIVGTAPGITITVLTPVTGGPITNSVAVGSNTTDANTGNNSDSEQTMVTAPGIQHADLSISKFDSPDPVLTGSMLTYTLVVTNSGPDLATMVTVTDELPAGSSYGGVSGDGWSCGQTGGVVSCTLPSLGIAVAPQIMLTVTAPVHSGTITNTATASSHEVDPDPRNNTARAVTRVKPAYQVYIPVVLR